MRIDFTKTKWHADDSGTWLSLLVKAPKDARKFHAERKDKDYIADLKEARKRRSLDANAYFWLLVNKLAAVTGAKPLNVYRHCIRDIGDNNVIVPIRDDAVETFIKNWGAHGIGWICDKIYSKLPGYTNVICYYGSSTYDTKQMSRLIDTVIIECKAQDIDTATPEEIERMKARWKDA